MTEPIALEPIDSFVLFPSSPFDFRHTLWKPSHFSTGLEQHSPTKSWRTFRIGEQLCGAVMTMTPAGALQLDIHSGPSWKPDHSAELARRTTHSYGLGEDLAEFVKIASKSEAMNHALEVFCGMRQSCPENLFEIAIISLLLQNATIARTTQMMDNLLRHYGKVVSFDGVTLRAFFTPKEIHSVTEEQLREVDRLGYRAKYIGRFAEFFIEHDPDLFETTDEESLMKEFQTIKGVGPYTAAIITSHAVRDHSAIGLDVWNRKILARKLLRQDDADAEVIRAELSRRFPGFEGLAGMYLVEEEYLMKPVSPLVSAE